MMPFIAKGDDRTVEIQRTGTIYEDLRGTPYTHTNVLGQGLKIDNQFLLSMLDASGQEGVGSHCDFSLATSSFCFGSHGDCLYCGFWKEVRSQRLDGRFADLNAEAT